MDSQRKRSRQARIRLGLFRHDDSMILTRVSCVHNSTLAFLYAHSLLASVSRKGTVYYCMCVEHLQETFSPSGVYLDLFGGGENVSDGYPNVLTSSALARLSNLLHSLQEHTRMHHHIQALYPRSSGSIWTRLDGIEMP